MIFYRSDTTPPNKIFSEGFKPKHRLESLFKSNGWLNFAIRSPNDDRVVCDASIYVVSLTYKFESAAIFPVNLTHLSPKSNNHGQEIYIYAISLPDRGIADASSKIEPNVAYDLHSKQVQDLSKILSSDYRLIHNTGYMGFMLAAYEAFAHEISAENIMYAVKCNRSNLLSNTLDLIIYTSNAYYHRNIDRTFVVDNVIFENPRFNPLSTADSSCDKSIALNKYLQIACKKFQTTTVDEALAGKTFALAKSETLGHFYYRRGYIDDYWYLVFLHMLCTAYTLVTLPYKTAKAAIFNKNPEIIIRNPPMCHTSEQTAKPAILFDYAKLFAFKESANKKLSHHNNMKHLY